MDTQELINVTNQDLVGARDVVDTTSSWSWGSFGAGCAAGAGLLGAGYAIYLAIKKRHDDKENIKNKKNQQDKQAEKVIEETTKAQD